MNYMYLPREGQFYQLPAMLTDEFLPVSSRYFLNNVDIWADPKRAKNI